MVFLLEKILWFLRDFYLDEKVGFVGISLLVILDECWRIDLLGRISFDIFKGCMWLSGS